MFNSRLGIADFEESRCENLRLKLEDVSMHWIFMFCSPSEFRPLCPTNGFEVRVSEPRKKVKKLC
jgi:hypothetical protein